ncbi:hypothetical protein Ciccas_007320 [Cichlidogyrus casuarinus]|uniref:Uncharacterized protein n=1 Tax=Cichlidogyrus casuarinus TaxID=1844966 RepID=A0ABD2Q377_9PLAT
MAKANRSNQKSQATTNSAGPSVGNVVPPMETPNNLFMQSYRPEMDPMMQARTAIPKTTTLGTLLASNNTPTPELSGMRYPSPYSQPQQCPDYPQPQRISRPPSNAPAPSPNSCKSPVVHPGSSPGAAPVPCSPQQLIMGPPTPGQGPISPNNPPRRQGATSNWTGATNPGSPYQPMETSCSRPSSVGGVPASPMSNTPGFNAPPSQHSSATCSPKGPWNQMPGSHEQLPDPSTSSSNPFSVAAISADLVPSTDRSKLMSILADRVRGHQKSPTATESSTVSLINYSCPPTVAHLIRISCKLVAPELVGSPLEKRKTSLDQMAPRSTKPSPASTPMNSIVSSHIDDVITGVVSEASAYADARMAATANAPVSSPTRATSAQQQQPLARPFFQQPNPNFMSQNFYQSSMRPKVPPQMPRNQGIDPSMMQAQRLPGQPTSIDMMSQQAAQPHFFHQQAQPPQQPLMRPGPRTQLLANPQFSVAGSQANQLQCQQRFNTPTQPGFMPTFYAGATTTATGPGQFRAMSGYPMNNPNAQQNLNYPQQKQM